MARRLRVASTLVLLTTLAAACGGGNPASAGDGARGTSGGASSGACSTYSPPASFDATSPAVSFHADVLPILVSSCGFSSCHGARSGAAGGMQISSDAATTIADLVGVPSNALPSMARVAAGDPAKSLLLHKIDGDACALPQCIGTCAESMPQGQALLAESDRLTIRRWIAQGAKEL
jgi:hypothetical protein